MVEIRKVETAADLRKFVSLPYAIYKDNPYWVPEVRTEEKAMLLPAKNPSLKYNETISFLAIKGGKAAGRVTAILNTAANEAWNESAVRFWLLDFIEDFEVAQALFAAVEDWARSKGMNRVQGPLGFCDLDKQGMLVEGFEEQDLAITIYNHPYYPQYMEKMGYTKKYDWLEFQVMTPEKPSERVQRIADLILRRNHFTILPLKTIKDIYPYLDEAFEVLNEAFRELPGVVELSREQADKYITEYIKYISPDYLCVVMDKNNKIAGYGVAVPSLGKAIRKSKGRLFPFGIFRLMRALKHNDSLDLYFIAIRPDMQNAGVSAVVLNEFTKNGIKNGIKWAETGPELEENTRMLALWKEFETRQHRRRRCYVKDLD
ncbi:MAG: hypothetical protein ACOYU3_03015 [Bacillota bacterium]